MANLPEVRPAAGGINDCGIDTVVALTGSNYRIVERMAWRWCKRGKGQPLTVAAIRMLLEVMTGQPWTATEVDKVEMRVWMKRKEEGDCAVLLDAEPGKQGHWVAVVQGEVIDSDRRRHTVRRRRGGLVVATVG